MDQAKLDAAVGMMAKCDSSMKSDAGERAAYDKAMDEFRAASKKFNEVRDSFRDKKVNSDTFATAKRAFDDVGKMVDRMEAALIKAGG